LGPRARNNMCFATATLGCGRGDAEAANAGLADSSAAAAIPREDRNSRMGIVDNSVVMALK